MSSSNFKDINIFIQQQRRPILQPKCELIGILDSVEPAGDGLLQIRVAGVERRVAEELEGQLRPLLGKRISILRAGDQWSAVEA